MTDPRSRKRGQPNLRSTIHASGGVSLQNCPRSWRQSGKVTRPNNIRPVGAPVLRQDNQRNAARVLFGAVNSGHLRHAKVQIIAGQPAPPGTVDSFPCSRPSTPCLRRASAPGWSQSRARQWWVTKCAVIPSRRRQRLRGKLADATGYPLPPSPVLRQASIPRAVGVLLRAVNHGQQRGTVTRLDAGPGR
jgi:hypothetical protein